MVRSLIFFSWFLWSLTLSGQSRQDEVFESMEGYWEGAFLKNNSYQKFDVRFYKEEEKLLSMQVMEEWHPQFGEFVLPVEIDSLGLIRFNTGLGKAVMRVDKTSLEMIGELEGLVPTIYVHLKKVPQPPAPDYNTEEVSMTNGAIMLKGHLHVPNAPRTKNAIVIVGGRGCYAGSTKYDLYAKLFRKYGISVLSYNKRGTGGSTGDCNEATIDDLASDLKACREFLANHKNEYEKIGVLGSSAGGWVMLRAAEMTDFSFLISVVGPATSVREQQLQSMEYGLDFYKLPESAKDQILEYTNLMFDAKPNQRNYDRFNALIKEAESIGWKELLDDTDIPSSPEGIADLWVRRHDFDPKNSLAQFSNPYLALYGEIDWIVPYKENIRQLESLFKGDRSEFLHTEVIRNAEHGTEVKEDYVELSDKHSYWRFFRISPQVQIELIAFLKRNNLISRE